MPVCTYTKYKGSVLEERAQVGLHSPALSLLQQGCVNIWKQPRNTMCFQKNGADSNRCCELLPITLEGNRCQTGGFFCYMGLLWGEARGSM